MIVMQKLKFMQDFTFAINVECLHSGLQAKLLKSVKWKISAYDAHIQ